MTLLVGCNADTVTIIAYRNDQPYRIVVRSDGQGSAFTANRAARNFSISPAAAREFLALAAAASRYNGKASACISYAQYNGVWVSYHGSLSFDLACPPESMDEQVNHDFSRLNDTARAILLSFTTP